jgi:flagellar hook assembly protein FlgD
LTATSTATTTPWADAGKIYVYPNPFKPDTASGHVLKFDNCPEGTEIRIYTVTGELVRKYADVSGKQTWDAKNTQGSDVASGVYMYVVVQSDGTKTMGKVFVVR